MWGRPRIVDDADWLRGQIDALTRSHEDQRSAPWHVADAPETFIAAQVRAIVGVEIPITRIEGKWKVSQNRPEADRVGVVRELVKEGEASAPMAQLVAERGGLNTKSVPTFVKYALV